MNSTLHPVAGIRLAAASAGIYGKARDDLALFALCNGARVGAAFTRNRFCAAPVSVAREHLQHGAVRYLLVNAGNANAGTGTRGVDDALQVCQALASRSGQPPQAVLPFSTGVIGEYLPVDKIREALPGLFDKLAGDAWLDCARAIMTTDTRPKGYSVQFPLAGETVTLTGIAKGAGMIKPDMATMLAFIATDAALEQNVLDRMLTSAVQQSFNRICVDGDTSTNDACVLVATGVREMDNSSLKTRSRKHVPPPPEGGGQGEGGKQPRQPIAEDSPTYRQLEQQLTELCINLAQDIVRDAEGATKFVTVQVDNAAGEADCTAIAEALTTSPLVKTALYASDPNWGRILAALGRSKANRLDINSVSIYLNEVCIVKNGARDQDYSEEKGAAVMQNDEIIIRIDLNQGRAAARYWTCDLSHDYVTINAEYRT